jgi:hypothetical protein
MFGVEMAPTVVMDYPSAAALSGYLAGMLRPSLNCSTADEEHTGSFAGAWNDRNDTTLAAGPSAYAEQALPLVVVRTISSTLPRGETALSDVDATAGTHVSRGWVHAASSSHNLQ